jgi:hypothetical protein
MRAVPYKTRLTGWLISENEGFGVTRRTPRHFMPGFIGFLGTVCTLVCTFQSEPISTVRA